MKKNLTPHFMGILDSLEELQSKTSYCFPGDCYLVNSESRGNIYYIFDGKDWNTYNDGINVENILDRDDLDEIDIEEGEKAIEEFDSIESSVDFSGYFDPYSELTTEESEVNYWIHKVSKDYGEDPDPKKKYVYSQFLQTMSKLMTKAGYWAVEASMDKDLKEYSFIDNDGTSKMWKSTPFFSSSIDIRQDGSGHSLGGLSPVWSK